MYANCQCPDAAQKISDGLINCEIERCPEECTVCSFCLEDILDCVPKIEPSPKPSKLPSKLPTISPSAHPTQVPTFGPSTEPSASPSSRPTVQPTTPPSIAPTSGPSAEPSVNPSSEPTVQPTTPPTPTTNPPSFDIMDCDAYRDPWTLELMTYGQCITAQSLVESGSITCDILPCPDHCSICTVCMSQLLECKAPTHAPSRVPTIRPTPKPSSPAFDISNCDSYHDRW